MTCSATYLRTHRPISKSKYGNIPTEYKGRLYASKLEADYAWSLDQRKKAKEIKSWEAQIKLPLKVGDHLICNYIIDFVVYFPDGMIQYVETKGLETDIWRIKWRLLEALIENRPEISMLLVN